MTPSLLDSCITRTLAFEGSIAWLYRDDSEKGWPTVGSGHACFTQADALLLPWQMPDGTPAPASQVIKDYQAVLAAPLGHTAAFYEDLTTCRLAPADIRGLTGVDIQTRMQTLRKYFPQWDQYPSPAIEALADCAYNLGPGFPPFWPALTRAVLANDWTAAAIQSHRAPPISAERNFCVSQLFLAAFRLNTP
jgi:GH24 family phage-related lysozyme (muramidase)